MATTGFLNANGDDIGKSLIDKEYVIFRYPSLDPSIKISGLWLWGYNGYGQLGDNTVTQRGSPVQTITSGGNWRTVSCGESHTAAIKTDGTLWSWGYNVYGQLGDNTTTSRSSPVQTISGGNNWDWVSCGGTHTAAIKTDGTLWTWGYNPYGQLGDNTVTQRGSPVQTIAGGNNWRTVSGGGTHTAAIKTDGTLWTWGYNPYGQLGDNSVTNRSSPVQTIAGGNNWRTVSCGSNHTVAIKTDGTLWSWGYNGYGQLGDNTVTSRSSPVQTIAGGTNWRTVSCGSNHTVAIKTDGTLWTWGYNGTGQLGDNTTTSRSSPVQTIAGGNNWRTVSCGSEHTVAIKTDGTLWSWGYNPYGQLGNNLTTNRSSPVQTISAGTNWRTVSCGQLHTTAVRDDSVYL